MDSESLLDAMKTIESEVVREGDHLDITQDREYESPNYHRLHVVDMLRDNKVKSSVYVSRVVFKPSPEETHLESFLPAPW
ncbi:hypothetical protein EU528_12990 [Candidatus Thorarchaeota archaeon]|nr:MAG: hypothetical protein EU528_12990 [Candidatus Thorarchaeota archaeon]